MIPSYVKSFQERAKDVSEHIDESISNVLGLDDVIKAIPRSAICFLGKDPDRCTFRDFIEIWKWAGTQRCE